MMRPWLERLSYMLCGRVLLPVEHEQLFNGKHPPLIVTQADSPIVSALIKRILKSYNNTADIQRFSRSRRENTVYWLPLNDPEGLTRWYLQSDHPEALTLTIYPGCGPVRTTSYYIMSPLRRMTIALTLIFSPRSLVVRFSKPFVFHAEGTHLGTRLVRQARLQIYKIARLVHGPPFQHLGLQERIILHSPAWKKDLSDLARRLDTSEVQLQTQAQQEFYSIAAHPMRIAFSAASVGVQLLMKQLFRTVSINGLDNIIKANSQQPYVLVPMHRSHLDYILLSKALYDSGLNPPIIAAGINLSFWPIGPLLRTLGAFFLRRNSRNDRIHTLVVRHYLRYLVKRGHLQEFFIEGGRSRSGKMRPPKKGLLKMYMEAYKEGLRKDILFVPVSITYERVIEDLALAQENTGQPKIRESLSSLIRARGLFFQKYGDVVIHFGQPIPLSSMYDLSKQQDEGNLEREAVDDMASYLVHTIGQHTAISLFSLACTYLLHSAYYGRFADDLHEKVYQAGLALKTLHSETEQFLPITPALESFLNDPASLFDSGLRGSIIASATMNNTALYYIKGQKRITADFYKNSCLQALTVPLLISIAHCEKQDIHEAGLLALLAHYRALFPPCHQPLIQESIRTSLPILDELGFLTRISDNAYSCVEDHALFLPALLLAPLESIVLLVYSLSSFPSHEKPSREKSIRFVQKHVKSLSYTSGLTRTEASSQTNLEAGWDYLMQHSVSLTPGTEDGSPEGKQALLRARQLHQIIRETLDLQTTERFSKGVDILVHGT